MKKCSKCSIIKSKNQFHRRKASKDGLTFKCKSCSLIYVNEYNKTFNGWLTKVYKDQRFKSIKRKMNQPNYTKKELCDFVKSRPNFSIIFNTWVESGYKTNLIPSLDRINDYKPYTLDNINLVTWDENNNKGKIDRLLGINNKGSKTVIQYDINGGFINEYYSTKQAERETGVYHSRISRVCNGKALTAGKFKWAYKKD